MDQYTFGALMSICDSRMWDLVKINKSIIEDLFQQRDTLWATVKPPFSFNFRLLIGFPLCCDLLDYQFLQEVFAKN